MATLHTLWPNQTKTYFECKYNNNNNNNNNLFTFSIHEYTIHAEIRHRNVDI